MATIEFIGLEMEQGSSTHHSAFMILIFNGNDKRFSNISDNLRIKYSKEKEFPIYFNPLNPTEFVYDNPPLKDNEFEQ